MIDCKSVIQTGQPVTACLKMLAVCPELCTNLTSAGNNSAQALCGRFLKSCCCGPLCGQPLHVVHCCQIIAQRFVMPSKSKRWYANQIILDLISLIIFMKFLVCVTSRLMSLHFSPVQTPSLVTTSETQTASSLHYNTGSSKKDGGDLKPL